MIQITPHMRIYLCIAPIDFRKGIEGLGKNAKTKKVNRSFKAVWGYPLHRNFKELLNHG